MRRASEWSGKAASLFNGDDERLASPVIVPLLTYHSHSEPWTVKHIAGPDVRRMGCTECSERTIDSPSMAVSS